jgi:hypothetical protein
MKTFPCYEFSSCLRKACMGYRSIFSAINAVSVAHTIGGNGAAGPEATAIQSHQDARVAGVADVAGVQRHRHHDLGTLSAP